MGFQHPLDGLAGQLGAVLEVLRVPVDSGDESGDESGDGEDELPAKTVIFAVDRSGSMSGEKIAALAMSSRVPSRRSGVRPINSS